LRRTAWFRRWLAAALDADFKPSSTWVESTGD
jgi:hypothetical protein